jgi:hypothetical protein
MGIPYEVYDITANTGWVSMGVDHDTAQFAAESLRRWRQQMGSRVYPKAKELLVSRVVIVNLIGSTKTRTG